MDSSDSSCGNSCSACGSWWRLPLLLGLLLTGIVLARSRGIRDSETPVTSSRSAAAISKATGEKVSLAVDFGDGAQRELITTGWFEGMTVEDLLGTVGQLPDMPEFAKQGDGASAFLTSIGGVANEGAGGRNWTYSVNGQRGDRSFAVWELRPGDRILWKFGSEE